MTDTHERYSISGIDISHHQGKVDFAKIATSGQRFVIVKATEGVGYVDPRLIENWKALIGYGVTRTSGPWDPESRVVIGGQGQHGLVSQPEPLYRGVYHFARPDSGGGAEDGEAEANHFCDTVLPLGATHTGCFAPVLDFEKYSDSGPRENKAWILAFVDVVTARFGRKPIIYTGKNVWRYELGGTADFDHLDLWLVRYLNGGRKKLTGPNPYPTEEMDELPWDRFLMWQWSGGGKLDSGEDVPGVKGPVDLNWFNGTEEEIRVACLAWPSVWAAHPDAGLEELKTLQQILDRSHTDLAASHRFTQAALGRVEAGIEILDKHVDDKRAERKP